MKFKPRISSNSNFEGMLLCSVIMSLWTILISTIKLYLDPLPNDHIIVLKVAPLEVVDHVHQVLISFIRRV